MIDHLRDLRGVEGLLTPQVLTVYLGHLSDFEGLRGKIGVRRFPAVKKF